MAWNQKTGSLLLVSVFPYNLRDGNSNIQWGFCFFNFRFEVLTTFYPYQLLHFTDANVKIYEEDDREIRESLEKVFYVRKICVADSLSAHAQCISTQNNVNRQRKFDLNRCVWRTAMTMNTSTNILWDELESLVWV